MIASENCCPTCGAPLCEDLLTWNVEERTLVANGMSLRFNSGEARVIDALWRSRNRGGIPTREQLMVAVYKDDPDGGPEGIGVVSTYVTRLRQKLSEVGYTITMNFGKPKRGYRIVPIDLATPTTKRT